MTSPSEPQPARAHHEPKPARATPSEQQPPTPTQIASHPRLWQASKAGSKRPNPRAALPRSTPPRASPEEPSSSQRAPHARLTSKTDTSQTKAQPGRPSTTRPVCLSRRAKPDLTSAAPALKQAPHEPASTALANQPTSLPPPPSNPLVATPADTSPLAHTCRHGHHRETRAPEHPARRPVKRDSRADRHRRHESRASPRGSARPTPTRSSTNTPGSERRARSHLATAAQRAEAPTRHRGGTGGGTETGSRRKGTPPR